MYQRCDINCRETFCQKTKKVEYQTYKCTPFYMSLYKSVNATLFVYGFYKIGPLMTDFSYPSLFTISTGKALCNIQIDKQENKQTFPVL